VVQVRGAALVLELDAEAVASTPDYPDEAAREQALQRLRLALDQLAAQE
jgi:tryptophanyl-tRNA synthetase